MTKKEIIQQINGISGLVVMRLNCVIRSGGIGTMDVAGQIYGFNTSAGMLARDIGIASMVWDRPEVLQKAA